MASNDDANFATKDGSELLENGRSSSKPGVSFEIGVVDPGEPESEICFSTGWDVGKVGVINITTLNYGHPSKSYRGDMKCVLTFQGSRTCTPLFSCYKPLSLRRTNKLFCRSDSVKLEDGLGGSSIFCGNDNIPLLKASRGGRDLFLTFRSGLFPPNPKLYKGISCYVKCLEISEIRKTVDLKHSILTRKETSFCKCGTRTSSGASKQSIAIERGLTRKEGRIIGGRISKMNEFPFLVPIVIKSTRNIRCGGSIINSQYVISAAHCFVVDNMDTGENFDVLVHAQLLTLSFADGEFPTVETLARVPGYGLDDVSDKDENTTRYTIVEKIFHPLFTTEGMDSDIALLKLDRKINFTSSGAVPICLPDHREANDTHGFDMDPYVNLSANIVGWGKPFEESAAFSRLPQALTGMPVIPYSKCQKLLSEDDVLSERMICAGFLEGKKDSCQGDSGSPLFVETANKTYLQIGITSWGDADGCAKKDKPGIYTDLRPLIQWIRFHTSETRNVEWCNDE